MIKNNTKLRNNVITSGSHGPVLLYGHGLGCDQTMWNKVTPAFASSHRQVLFDYVGSGKSQRSAFDASRYSHLQGYAQDLIDVCDALELRSGVTFVGHSVSCSIGLIAALTRPELFESMVLLGPSPCFINYPSDYLGGFERADLEGLLLMMSRDYLGWAEYLSEMIAGAQQPASAQLHASFCSSDPEAVKTFAHACFLADDRAVLSKVKLPCLILQHRHDALVPLSVGEFCNAQLQGSDLKILDVSGHCAHISHPELVIAAMRRYFGRSLPA